MQLSENGREDFARQRSVEKIRVDRAVHNHQKLLIKLKHYKM